MDPKKTIIAVDIHGVLFNHDYKAMLKTYFKSKNKLKLIIALLNPYLWVDTIKLMHQDATAEEFLVGLADKYNRLKPFVPLGIEIANQQKPNKDLLKLLSNLKKNKYKLYIFSNIGSIIFDDLLKKNPAVFKLFDDFTVPSLANGYRRKPQKEAFETFLKQHNAYDKQVIFIDGEAKNISSAEKHGITGILFENIDQLQKKLRSLGILTKLKLV